MGEIARAICELEAGRIEGVTFEDGDVGAIVRIAAKDKDRYLAVTGAERGGGREEWRSGGWIRAMLDRGHWTVTGIGNGGGPASVGGPAPHADAAAAGIRIRRPLRGGFLELALPDDVAPEEARAALAEIDRLATFVRTLA